MKKAVVVLAALSLAVQPAHPHAPVQLAASGKTVACPEPGGVEAYSPIVSRVGPPDAAVLEIFSGAATSAIAVHQLTPPERVRLQNALAKLPRLHRDVLQRHLRRLSFLDLESGGGSALTSKVGPDDASTLFDITFRASLLAESLTKFLNTKEARLFVDDGSGFSVEFDAGPADALTYVLLHEATHIVDQVLGLTEDAAGPFMSGVWADVRALSQPHADSLAASTPFRRQPPIPLRYAPAYYESLRQSPFVSFYATAAASEDVAELLAWQQLATRFDQPLTLTVRDLHRVAVYRYEPLAGPAIQSRFADWQELLSRHEQGSLLCAGEVSGTEAVRTAGTMQAAARD